MNFRISLWILFSFSLFLSVCEEEPFERRRRPYLRREGPNKRRYGFRASLQDESPGSNNRLQTQFFNLRDEDDLGEGREGLEFRSTTTSSPSLKTTPSSFTKARSKIPVLVKKLAKRPTIKSRESCHPHCSTTTVSSSEPELSGLEGMFALLRKDIWVIPLIVGGMSVLIILSVFEVFLISKAFRSNPSRRHLFLGQILLIGLFLCACTSMSHALEPTEISCSVARLGTGISYSVVFSTLLVKLVFLISLNSGVYLPGTYQCLLLCFAILIQVVIGVQWILSSPVDSNLGSECDLDYSQFLFSLLYVFFLMGMVCLLAFKARGIRENYRESSYIGLVMIFSASIFVIWIIGGFIAPQEYRTIGTAGGLLAISAITFIIMFMPKGRQLSAIGKEGIYSEDRGGNGVYTDSSTQSTGSGTPSPSFFPVKPGKFQFRERLDTPPSHIKSRHGIPATEHRRECRASHIQGSRHPVFNRASRQQQQMLKPGASSLLRVRHDSRMTEDSYISGIDIFTYLRNEQRKSPSTPENHCKKFLRREEDSHSTLPRRDSENQQKYSRTNPNVTFRKSSEMNGSGLLY